MKNEVEKVLMTGRFPSWRKDLNAFILKVEKAGGRAFFVIESTSFCVPIYDIIAGRGHQIKAAHPLKVEALTACRAKTDRNAAEMRAELLRIDPVLRSYVPPKDIRELRDVTSHRSSLIAESTTLRNKIHAELARVVTRPPAETHFSFSKKIVESLRSLGVAMIDDLLDILEIVQEKVKKVNYRIDK